MKQRVADMKEYIYKVRPDGLSVLNLRKIDEKIRIAAKFLSRSNKILVVGRKTISHEIISKFSEVVGAQAVVGRYLPGTPALENILRLMS
jgi:small subunit ribosomal protein S2